MSLITRCPACQTLFRVVPDQLRISEGWVRCGQCEEVFDASAHLFQETQATPVVEPTMPVDAMPEATAGPVPQSVPLAVTESNLKPDLETETVEAVTEARVEPVLESGTLQENAASPEVQSAPAFKPDINAALRPPVEETDFPPVSFMREAVVESAWQRPLVRAALGITSFLLLLVLGLQVSVQERDRIVALHPEARPLLQALCVPLQCGLSPLRQIDSIVIDNSSFAKIRGDAYRLGLSIKNSAPIEVAMPSLELTLTDSQDQTVLRRVFSPAEFGAPSNALLAGGEWSGGLAVNALDVGGVERITGYRVLAFYP